MKNNLSKSIDFKDIKNSPWTIAVILFLVIVLVITIIVFLVKDIMKTKEELTLARETLAGNVTELASLEELRAKSEEAEQKLKYYEGILPEKLDDVYFLEEKLAELLPAYGLQLNSMEDPTQIQSTTVETVFKFSVSGSYKDIISFMQYMSDCKQIHRIDSAVLSTDGVEYSADISLALLSQNGADGIATEGAIEEAVAEAVDDAEEVAAA